MVLENQKPKNHQIVNIQNLCVLPNVVSKFCLQVKRFHRFLGEMDKFRNGTGNVQD